MVPKAGHDMYTGEKKTVREKASRRRNSNFTTGTMCRISKFFQRRKQKLYIYFSI
jgi:hypothetical protein